MAKIYFQRIKDGIMTLDKVPAYWKVNTCVLLINDGFWTIDNVPVELQEQVKQKLATTTVASTEE